ncbi:MAG: ACT domain-containing protein [Mogibacterium sp.]|nr:ACT domain-containing protein [Mogibacterium sp.]
MTIEPLDVDLSVCKVEDYSQVDICQPFCFTGSTDEELSLVCPTKMVPDNTTERDDGWRAFRIVGVLDFSLVGILAGISEILAENKIGLFAVSTYNTDYILTKAENYERALDVLRNAGYTIK